MASKAKIGVVGASGYTGGELVRMLLRHPRAEIVLLTAERSVGKAMREVFPHSRRIRCRSLLRSTGLIGRKRLSMSRSALYRTQPRKR